MTQTPKMFAPMTELNLASLLPVYAWETLPCSNVLYTIIHIGFIIHSFMYLFINALSFINSYIYIKDIFL